MALQRDVCHLVFSIGCQLRKVLSEGPFGVGHTFGLRAKKIPDWRLDRRHQRRRQGTKERRVDAALPLAEEVRAVGHETEDRTPIGNGECHDVLVAMAQSSLKV